MSINEYFSEKLVLVLSEAVLVLVIDYDYEHEHESKFILKLAAIRKDPHPFAKG